MLISCKGLSCRSVSTFSIALQTSIPFTTRPKTVCLLSNHGVGTVVMKNCDPFVSWVAGVTKKSKGVERGLRAQKKNTLQGTKCQNQLTWTCVCHGDGEWSIVFQTADKQNQLQCVCVCVCVCVSDDTQIKSTQRILLLPVCGLTLVQTRLRIRLPKYFLRRCRHRVDRPFGS